MVQKESSSLARILFLLDECSVQGGQTHPAEYDLDIHIDRFGPSNISQCVSAVSPLSLAASLLRLLGRTKKVWKSDRRFLVSWGIESESLEVRDAAVQAVESWEDGDLVDLLQEHVGKEPVRWLQEYIDDIIKDFGR